MIVYQLIFAFMNDIHRYNFFNNFIVPMTIWIPTLANTAKPLYKKLADAIEQAIIDKVLAPQQKLPPQRQLADTLGVTIGTITRGYNEAERRGIVIARVGSGTYVKQQQAPIYLSPKITEQAYDLRSANAPMGLQLEMMTLGLAELAAEKNTIKHCLRYQAEDGMPHQRTNLVNWLSQRDIHCDEKQVLFTNGGQHAITLALNTCCLAGDTVLAEGLSFPGISIACQQQQLRCIGLAMDDDGITPTSLLAAIKQSHPRILYLTAQFQNPTCSQMSLNRKRQILSICQQHQLIIIEDDVQFLPYQDKTPSFYQLDPKSTIYISSFSKSFSGGLRIGYLITNATLREKIKLSLRANCWTLPPLTIELVSRWLSNGKMAQLERWLAEEMTARNAILQKELAGFEIKFHIHGYNAWLTLPETWRAVDFVNYAEQHKVLVRAAESYAVGRFPAPQNIRLCVCAPENKEKLKEALIILKQCLNNNEIKINVNSEAIM